METAEDADYRIEAVFDLNLWQALQARPELFVRELSDVDRRELLLVHKLLECIVTGALELHLVRERVANHLVHLGLEG